MKRVLIITYYWPPVGGSGVQRWVKFSKYLPASGWQPVIYTPENPEQQFTDDSLLKDIPQEAEILKTHISEPYDVYRRLAGKGASTDINLNTSKKATLKQKLATWVRGNFFIPDPRIGWVKPSVKYLEEYLKEHPVDVMVTTGPPQSLHLIGRELHRKTGIPWVADFRDPWTKMFYFKHLGLWPMARRKHEKLEKSVLDEASAIIAVTPMVREEFQAMTKTPVHLITNGFDHTDFNRHFWPRKTKKFVLLHTGILADDGNPLNLWHELSDICRRSKTFRETLQIRLAGRVDPTVLEAIKLNGLGKNTIQLGYLSHEKVVREQRSADVLLFPLRQEPESRASIHGKLFEYLAARKPILGIGDEDGASARIIEETGSGKMFDWDKDASVGKFIREQWDAFRSGEKKPIKSDIKKYSRKSLTVELAKLLDSLVK